MTDLKTAGPLNARVVDLDEVAHAAGDPSAVAFAPDGRTVVALGGVGEAAIVAPPGHPLRRFEVGRRPSAVALSPDGKMAYFADPDADSVATVSTEGGTNRKRVTLGPRPEPSAVERGERLFRDARLSHHGWLSCASCHTDGHTIGGLADTLGDGSYGAPKLVPSLFGVKSTGPWGWLGNLPDLGTQVKKSVETTMRGDSPDEAKVADLVAYLDSLELPVARPTVDPSAASRGKAIFKAQLRPMPLGRRPDLRGPVRRGPGRSGRQSQVQPAVAPRGGPPRSVPARRPRRGRSRTCFAFKSTRTAAR